MAIIILTRTKWQKIETENTMVLLGGVIEDELQNRSLFNPFTLRLISFLRRSKVNRGLIGARQKRSTGAADFRLQ